ncbi:MAG: hypothetical protein KGZ25_09000, partial [Planctomycetes bacterium]|nr:hypothetical protein [Planctomycetota bacterium]
MLLWIDPLNHLLARLEMRALLAFCTSFTVAFVLAVPVIRWLRQNEFGEQTEKTPIEDEQLRNQIAAKSGTPTMGGIIIAIATLLTCLVWGNFGSLSFWLLVGVYLALGSMGFIDDWMKMQAAAHRERGLKVRHKLILQGFIGAVAGYIWYRFGNPNIASSLPWPTFGWLIGAGGAILAAIWVALIVATMSN